MNLEQQIKDLSDEVIIEKSFKRYTYPSGNFKHNNPEYETYVSEHHAVAISFVRDALKEVINVNKFWFDIILAPNYQSANNGVVFPFIVYALYPREVQPNYAKCEVNGVRDNDMARYVTWETSIREIKKYKQKKVTPEYYILSPRVYSNPKAQNVFLGLSGQSGSLVISQEALGGFIRSERKVRGLKRFSIDELIKIAPQHAKRITEKKEEIFALVGGKGKPTIQQVFKMCGIPYKGKYATSKAPRKNIHGAKKRRPGR